MPNFPFYDQLNSADCGPACVRMIAKFYGKSVSPGRVSAKGDQERVGMSLFSISEIAESLGFRSMGVQTTFAQLEKSAPFPCIAHWDGCHFVVLYKIKRKRVYVADPAQGLVQYDVTEFLERWVGKGSVERQGALLVLEPTTRFFTNEEDSSGESLFQFLFKYVHPYRKFFLQLVLGLVFGSLAQLVFPFLTQSVVDIGIGTTNLDFIYLVLIAQLVLTVSRTSADFIRNWIVLHIGSRINLALGSDFLAKMAKLPMSFFDSRTFGDILQRMADNQRIESFLTNSVVSFLFAIVTFIMFSFVLALYSARVFLTFVIGSVTYIGWISVFMKKRRHLDVQRFKRSSENQNAIMQMIAGIQEIKLNDCERRKRWEWQGIRAKLFRVTMKGLSVAQMQEAGALLVSESRNIVITVIAAQGVLDGQMTLGMMLAVQYIQGQLNGPIGQFVEFMRSAQDAKISLERLREVFQEEEEVPPSSSRFRVVSPRGEIQIDDLWFKYHASDSHFVLNGVSLRIPENKTTAIVGISGSGKTTLLKLLLGFYNPTRGNIHIGGSRLSDLDVTLWRERVGVVMQDGFIFSDSVARNIAPADEVIDFERLLEAARLANVLEFVDRLPLGFNTKIGREGLELSAGQKQRILIARAVYKDPLLILFDEATNALDTKNESTIMGNLREFFSKRMVVLVAHRLSTVKEADQIVVLEKGNIIESGTHHELVEVGGIYHRLVRDQLALGA